MVFEKLKAAFLGILTHISFISRKVGFSRRCPHVPSRAAYLDLSRRRSARQSRSAVAIIMGGGDGDRAIYHDGDYIRSFINAAEPRIRSEVEKALTEGLLSRDPLVQLNPTFQYEAQSEGKCLLIELSKRATY